MAVYEFLQSMRSMVAGDEKGVSLSRRDMLSGVGLVGALAVAGPTLLMPDSAEAVEIVEDADEGDAEVTPVHERRRRRRRGRRSTRRQLRSRRRRPTRRRHTRRYHYGDIYNRCRYDGRFRRRNRRLCSRVLHARRPRRGACFSMRIDGASFSICG